jgi:1-acyl-sn-glycerol-3-phosphate acyltransferase
MEQLEKRQTEYLNKECLTPLLIFPEGTVTNGKYILKMKKGAFHSLLPLKPLMVHDANQICELSAGSMDLIPHVTKILCFLYHDISVTELPIIRPTEFMFDNYPNKSITEKWEIFAEVVRDIYCEVGGFQKSDKTLRDSVDYYNLVMGITKKPKTDEKPKKD